VKIPRKVKLFNRHYDVVRDDRVIKEYSPHCWGMIEFDRSFIAIKKRQEDFQEYKEAETFMHEIIHGIDEVYGLKLSESKVNLLAQGLVTVIRDNKLNFTDDV